MIGKQLAGVALVVGANLLLFTIIGFFVGFKTVFLAVGIALCFMLVIAFGLYLMEEQ